MDSMIMKTDAGVLLLHLPSQYVYMKGENYGSYYLTVTQGRTATGSGAREISIAMSTRELEALIAHMQEFLNQKKEAHEDRNSPST